MDDLQNHNQGVNIYVTLNVEFKKILEDITTNPAISFRTEVYRVLNRAPEDINNQVVEMLQMFNENIDTFIQNGSGWVFNIFTGMQIKIFHYTNTRWWKGIIRLHQNTRVD